jgi:aspartate/methionine/tyrosine aminotransferase
MEVMEEAARLTATGASVIHLEVGEPDFPSPRCVFEAGQKALAEGHTHYTHSLGLQALREAIAELHREGAVAPVNAEQILVTAGTSPALLLLFGALLEQGDEVILPNPYYSCYLNVIRFLGGTPVLVTVRPEEGFQYDPDDVKAAITGRTRVIVINSPSNPTGAVLDAERIAAIAALGVPIISDEIYHGLVYGVDPPRSILTYTEDAFVIDGFSKRYAMTGWRLGYVIVPPPFVRALQRLSQNFYISAADFVQWAGLAALRDAGPDVERMARTYNERRLYLAPELRRLGFGVPNEGQGAFYIFADIRPFGLSSTAFVKRLLHEAHVAATPGNDFGTAGEGFVRFSYANSLENITEAVRRMDRFLGTL